MRDQNIISIKMMLEGERRRIDSMLYLIDKVKTSEDLEVIARGFELSEQFMNEGHRLCEEVAL